MRNDIIVEKILIYIDKIQKYTKECNYGLRNRIVHDYDGVNLILVWEIIESDLPELKIMLEKL